MIAGLTAHRAAVLAALLREQLDRAAVGASAHP